MNFKDLEKFEKCNIFKKFVKIYHKQNFNCLVFFKSDRPVCAHILLKLLSKTFFLKKTILHFNPKNFEVKENC